MCWYKHNACQCLQASLPWPRVAEACTQQGRDWHICTNTVQLVGSCVFYLVHPHTKHLQEVIFYVANNNVSALLCCVSTCALGLIQPHARLDYLPPGASLITSSAYHPKKTKSQANVHVAKKESTVSAVSSWQGTVDKHITSKDQILQALIRYFWWYRMLSWTPIPYSRRS